MNNLKYIPRISVPRYDPFGAGLLSRQHADMYLEKRTFKFQTVDSIFIANRNHALGAKYSKEFRRNLRLVSKERKVIYKQIERSSVTLLKKKSSVNRKLQLENIVKSARYYFTCQNIKFDSSGINNTFQNESIINDANIINRHNSVVASISKHHRSYAEMIADYSEILRAKSTTDTRSVSLYFNNGIRKSPFSTVSAPNISRFVKRSKISNKKLEDDSLISTDARKSFDFQHHDINKNIDQECTKSDDQSYAKLVADCSKYMHTTFLSNVTNSGLILKSNVLSRNSRKSFATPTRNASSTNMQETSSAISKAAVTKAITGEEMDDYWTKEIRSVMNDLNTAIKRKTAKAEKSHEARENGIPESDFAKLQDRINKLTEIIEAHKQKEEDTTIREANLQSRNFSHGDETSDLPPYFSRATTSSPATGTSATSSSKVKKTFTQMPSGENTGVLKQPQVKLRMVPSEKESVVSINVDSATGLSDSLDPASKQLSVIVQSDQQQGDAQSTENQWNAPTLQQNTKSTSRPGDFGPMRISISEDSAPIKQIEFSINGKPVSELKSITARTEKLDVVSSMDKIEIRIPFAKDNASTPSNIRENVFAKETDLSSGQILNVQISANFQNEFTKNRIGRTTEGIHTTPPSPLNTLKTNTYAFETSADKTMTNSSSVKEKKTLKGRKVEMKTVRNTVHFPEIHKNDIIESSDDSRIPSKMIPWWSSSDSFKKIKKKEENEDLSSKKKTSLNLKMPQNPITKSEKSEETPKSSMNKIQSMNNATITNSSSDTISYSTEHLVESKPSSHYSPLLRVKSDQEKSTVISNISKHVSQRDNLATEEDNKKNFEIKQIKPITLHPGTERHINIKERNSILKKRCEMPTSAENFSLQGNCEKKRQYSLKQTLSIEDVPNTKTEIQNVQNIMKSVEKRHANTWVDYGSRTKSIEKLNNKTLVRSAKKEKMRKTPQVEQNVTSVPTGVKMQNRTINNTPHVRKDDATALNSSNLKSSPNVTQTTKQEKVATNTTVPRDKFKQTLKTLSESSKINSSSLVETSSKAMRDSVKLHNEITSTNELFSLQTGSNSISNIKNERIVTEMSISADKLNKKTDIEDTIAKVVSQNPKNRDLISNSEKHSLLRTSKSGDDRRNVAGSVNSPRKPTSTGLLSTRSKMDFTVTSKDNCTYTKKLPFIELLYPNFDRKDNASLDSQLVIFDSPRDLKNVGNISDHNAPNIIAGSCTDTDRPKKNILYSAWLRQLRKDVNKNEKLL